MLATIQELLTEAPPRVRGRRPTAEEQAASKAHNEQVTSLLQSFPDDIRQQLIGKQKLGHRAKKHLKQVHAAAASQFVPASLPVIPTSDSSSSTTGSYKLAACPYLEAIAKPIHYLAVLDLKRPATMSSPNQGRKKSLNSQPFC